MLFLRWLSGLKFRKNLQEVVGGRVFFIFTVTVNVFRIYVYYYIESSCVQNACLCT
jgi:hypothetical protein